MRTSSLTGHTLLRSLRQTARNGVPAGALLALTLAGAPLLPAHAAAASAAVAAAPAAEHDSVKRPFTLPQSADLAYSIKVRQHGMALSGEAMLNWRNGDGKYSIVSQTKVPIFGVILDSKSEGVVDDFGLAPTLATEKRFRKEPTTVSFKREAKTITFSESDESYPIKGGEQDRTSTPWQLMAVARGAPEKFTPGSEWVFFVAGRRDAEPWSFKVDKQETVHTGQGDVSAVHLVKAPPAEGHSKDQQVDIWLAPSLGWYPVRIRLLDADGDFVEQTLEKITNK